MSYDNYYKRRGGKEKSHRDRSRHLDNTTDSRALFNCNTSVRQVWTCEPENENGSFSSCPIHGPSQRVWRLVGQDSKESHAIFEHGYKPPCPVHNPKACVGSVNSSGNTNTAILDDEIITVEPEPRQEPQLTRNRPRRSHSRSRQSLVNSNVERPSSRRSMCSIRSHSKHRSSMSTIGERLEATFYANSLWNFLKNFCLQYPRPAMVLGFLLFLYFFIHQLDFTIAHILECIIRFVYPFSHYIAVTNEQFFARLSRMATRSDEMMEAVYCDFALSWCQRFGLMCEVQCSFVEQSLQRIRKHPH